MPYDVTVNEDINISKTFLNFKISNENSIEVLFYFIHVSPYGSRDRCSIVKNSEQNLLRSQLQKRKNYHFNRIGLVVERTRAHHHRHPSEAFKNQNLFKNDGNPKIQNIANLHLLTELVFLTKITSICL